MSIWMELHCDPALDERSNGCLTNRNDSLVVMVNNCDVLLGRKILARRAGIAGWKRTKQGWMCPPCYERAKGGPRK